MWGTLFSSAVMRRTKRPAGVFDPGGVTSFFLFSFFLPPALVVGNEKPRGAEGRLGLDVINKKVG
jgi:hypothetical protein